MGNPTENTPMRYYACLFLAGILLLFMFGPAIFTGAAVLLMSIFGLAVEIAAPLAVAATIAVVIYALAR